MFTYSLFTTCFPPTPFCNSEKHKFHLGKILYQDIYVVKIILLSLVQKYVVQENLNLVIWSKNILRAINFQFSPHSAFSQPTLLPSPWHKAQSWEGFDLKIETLSILRKIAEGVQFKTWGKYI